MPTIGIRLILYNLAPADHFGSLTFFVNAPSAICFANRVQFPWQAGAQALPARTRATSQAMSVEHILDGV
jgi:hypothetical protein